MSGVDATPEVFARRLGALMQVDSSSDADLILDKHIDRSGFMRFRLTYSGELKAAGNNKNRPVEKWQIRNQIHPQLEELWQVDIVLQGKGFYMDNAHSPEGYVMRGLEGEEQHSSERERLRKPIPVNGHLFLPLVRKSLALTCSLDILFLRKDGGGSLVTHGGDLDARMKILFDGLRMPNKEEMAYGTPAANPHYCLLEDDALITDVTVRTDRLLSRSGASASEVLLIIDVVVQATEITDGNIAFCLPLRR